MRLICRRRTSRRPTRILASVVGAATIMFTLGGATSVARASGDAAPPSQPQLVDVDGFQCLEVFVMFNPSSDNVDPQSALRYDVFADGQFIGSFANNTRGYAYALHEGPSSITVKAIDTAGNASRASDPLVATTTLWPC